MTQFNVINDHILHFIMILRRFSVIYTDPLDILAILPDVAVVESDFALLTESIPEEEK